MKRIRILSLILAALLLLAGCDPYAFDEEEFGSQNVQNVEDGTISGRRTGILRQGIAGQFKAFEVTEERVYFMVSTDMGATLYSMKHDSDTLEPLCALSGCDHTSEGCGAYFGNSGNVCFYEDMLYVHSGTKLYQMNPDGSNRMPILDVKELESPYDNPFNGIAEAKLWNGVFTFYAFSYYMYPSEDELYYEVNFAYYEPYYYLLDGSMDEPRQITGINEAIGGSLVAQYNDGLNFIMQGPGYKADPPIYHLYSWNPQKNDYEWFADVSKLLGEVYEPVVEVPGSQNWLYQNNSNHMTSPYGPYTEGYWGKDCAYFLQTEEENSRPVTNKICQLNYANGTPTVLLDTGLEGSYKMACFPDCIVLIETVNIRGKIPEIPAMYIYDWNMELVAQGTLDCELAILPQEVICGETAGRIYLAAHHAGVPEYFLEKEELETGELVLHPVKYENYDPMQNFGRWEEMYETALKEWQDHMMGMN